jgi:hypothetical protein
MSRAGKSFERAIAYFLTSAGFKTSKEPHLVRLEGTIEPVGDLDIVAVDPQSNERIAVTCKERGDSTPSSSDFNHFIRLMDIEGIRHGIVAWTNVPSTVYSLITDAEKRGYHLAVIDSERYDELNDFMIDGETWRIEEYFRRKLHLARVAPSAPPSMSAADVEHPLITTAKRLGLSTEGKTQQQISDEIIRTVRPAKAVDERVPSMTTGEGWVRSDLYSFIVRWVHWLVRQGEEYDEHEERQFRTMTFIVFATALAILLGNSVYKGLWGGVLLWGGLLFVFILFAYYKRGEMSFPVLGPIFATEGFAVQSFHSQS